MPTEAVGPRIPGELGEEGGRLKRKTWLPPTRGRQAPSLSKLHVPHLTQIFKEYKVPNKCKLMVDLEISGQSYTRGP